MDSYTTHLTIKLLPLSKPIFIWLISSTDLCNMFNNKTTFLIFYRRGFSLQQRHKPSSDHFCTNNLFYCSAKRRTVRLKWFISVPTPSVQTQSERWKHGETHTNNTWTSALWPNSGEWRTNWRTKLSVRTDEGQNTVFTVSSVSASINTSDRLWWHYIKERKKERSSSNRWKLPWLVSLKHSSSLENSS